MMLKRAMNRMISININIPAEQLRHKDLDVNITINPIDSNDEEDAGFWNDFDDLK